MSVKRDEDLVYRVEFLGPRDVHHWTDIPRARGIEYIKQGFWVDEHWRYALPSASVHWIPPGRVILVTKVELSGETEKTQGL